MFEWLFKNNRGSVEDFLQIIATDLTKVQLALMAQEKAAGMIAKAIAKSEIVLTKGETRRKDEAYYRLNIRPNDNETATDFWFNVARALVATGDCVVVRMQNGKYYRANSYQMDNYVLFGKTYSNIVLTDGYNEVSLRYGVSSDDILHFRYSTDKMRLFTKNVLDNLNDALNAVHSLETIANTPLLKFKVDANLQFRRRTADGKEVRLTLDNVLDEFKSKIDGKKLAILTEQTGTSLEFMDVKKQVSASELAALTDAINKECAAAYDIPLGVFNGQITEQSDATNEFITYAVSPVAEVINDTLNAKLVGQDDYVKGERAFVWLAHFKHIDVIDAANSLDKLRAIGFTLDEIFEMVGYPALNTEFSTARALTKNYATEGMEESVEPTGSADDPVEESMVIATRKPSKHKERRAKRERAEKVLSADAD